MKLEDQVVSLGLAKRLKELGVKQESLFVWWSHPNAGPDQVVLTPQGECDGEIICSAFTVAELGEMLPARVCSWQFIGGMPGKKWICYPRADSVLALEEKRIESFYAETEADARGRMLAYLLENKFMDTPR